MKRESKMTGTGQEFVSDEISHLMRDGPSKGPQKGKTMPQKQAIAVALDVAKHKGFKLTERTDESFWDDAPKPSDTDTEVSPMRHRDFRALDRPEPVHQSTEILTRPAKTPEPTKPVKPKPLIKPSSKEYESMSIFDSIIESKPTKSLFDGIVERTSVFDSIVAPPTSAFDDIVEGSGRSLFDGIVESKNGTAAAWDDRVARTLTLSEELVEIRDRSKK